MDEVRSLRDWRRLKGYGQRELSRLAGLAHTTVNDLEHGRSRGQPATWRRIAQVLGIQVTQIVEYRRAVGLDTPAVDG